MKEIPFIYGKLASSYNFTDRKNEVSKLMTNFKAGINTIIISPRRWGKSSLVSKVAESAQEEDAKLKIVLIDLFNIRTEEEFYLALAKGVLEQTSTKLEETIESAKTLLSRLMPRISFSVDQQNEISFGISTEDLKKDPSDILDLADLLAKTRKLKIVICIDEFQNIAYYDDPLGFQKKLRSHWQKHSNVSYCIYGSKRHMLLDVFSSPSMPFYKFGDLMFLQKIEKEEWIKFISRRFTDTGKSISNDHAGLIASLANNHPYYVQQLAQLTWFRTTKNCNELIVEEAFESLVDQLSLLFINSTESLTASQLGFLKAVVSGENQISSQKSLKEFKIGTSANVSRIKQNLYERELIDINKGVITFQDPIYKYWLEKSYFKI